MQPNTASNETKLPRAVIKRSAAIAARYAKPDEPDEPNPASENAAPASPPAAPPAPPIDAQPPTPPADPRVTDPAYWQQRFQVTQGILSRERQERATQVEDLHRKVDDLTAQLRTSQVTKPTDDKIDVTQFYTPEQIEKYGEEQCESMARTAMRAASKVAQDQIAAAVQPLKDQQTRAVANAAADAKRTFVEQLTELYPNYAAVDVDPRWLKWLAEDENGVERNDILQIHIDKRDARAIARMLKAWEKTTVAAPAPVPPPAPPITPSGSGASPGSDAPEAPRNPAAAEAGYPGKAEIKDFYKRAATVRKGQPGYVTDQDRVAFEARLALRTTA